MGFIGFLLKNYHKNNVIKFNKFDFLGVENLDVYNPSAPFELNGEKYILGRVEKRGIKSDSRVFFFRKKNLSTWERDFNLPIFKLEDPFIKKIGKEYIFGGVEVKRKIFSKKVKFRTVFYKGEKIFSLKRFFDGPWGMKDIRLEKANTGKIVIFTRPMGKKFKRGRIGFIIINSLDELSTKSINNAKILNIPFSEKEWGGVNEVFAMDKNTLGVLGHVAHAKNKEGEKFYYPISFCFDVLKKRAYNFKILFTRKELPFEKAKNSLLYNVIFPGGIVWDKKKNSKIYVGVGDSKTYEVEIENPFKI